jgi:hypothetical protein
MDMMSAAKAARIKAGKLKLCDSLAAYLAELAPKQAEGVAEVSKSIDHQGMQVMGKAHGDSAETDPWATLAGGKKGKKGKKKKGGKPQGSSGLQHSMIRLNGFAEVRCGTKGCPVHVPASLGTGRPTSALVPVHPPAPPAPDMSCIRCVHLPLCRRLESIRRRRLTR